MSANEPIDVVFVEIGGKPFGFPANKVSEVLPVAEPTAVPGWPAHALGLIDVRGELVPLVDVSQTVGMRTGAISPEQFVLIVVSGTSRVGLLVDRVDGVRPAQVSAGESLAPAELLPASSWCWGIAVLEARPVVLLNAEGLAEALRVPELAARAVAELEARAQSRATPAPEGP